MENALDMLSDNITLLALAVTSIIVAYSFSSISKAVDLAEDWIASRIGSAQYNQLVELVFRMIHAAWDELPDAEGEARLNYVVNSIMVWLEEGGGKDFKFKPTREMVEKLVRGTYQSIVSGYATIDWGVEEEE